jgi:hypothetical protein
MAVKKTASNIAINKIEELEKRFHTEQERLVQVEVFSKEANEYIKFVAEHKIEDHNASSLRDELKSVVYNSLTIDKIQYYRVKIQNCKYCLELLDRGYVLGRHDGIDEGWNMHKEFTEEIIPSKVIDKYAKKEKRYWR